MTTITLENLKTKAIIGVEDWERLKPTRLLATLTVVYNGTAAESTDQIQQAIDYAALAEDVDQWIRSSAYTLLESLCGFVCQKVLEKYSLAESVHIRICKPRILPKVAAVWVESQRCRPSK